VITSAPVPGHGNLLRGTRQLAVIMFARLPGRVRT
jgi:hypothetical protein